MDANFSQPQRQSSVGILVLFVTTLQQYARTLWPIIVIWLLKYETINKFYFFGSLIGVLLILALISYLNYLNFTFHIEESSNELIINEGILKKTKTTIQLHKIQQVAINQSFIQKIIGVFELNVDTAGSTQKEVKIKAISHEKALALKFRLIENQIDSKSISIPEVVKEIVDEKPVLKTSFITLLKVGLTSNYIKSFSLVLLFVITLFDYFEKITGNKIVEKEKLDALIAPNQLISFYIVLLLFLVLIILLVNVVRIMVNYFDFIITKQNNSLFISYGLFNSKSTIIKPERVQIVSIVQNYFQKKLNLLEIKIIQATGGEHEQHKTAIQIPGCSTIEQNEIVKLLFERIPIKGAELQPNYRKLVVSVIFQLVLPIALLLIYSVFFDFTFINYYFALPLYGLVISGFIYYSFNRYRLFVSPEFIIKQSGAWDIKNQIIEIKRIQAITTSQFFWHKKANIGTLKIHTAGGTIDFKIGNFTKINDYVNLWLYKVENSDSNWM